MEKKNLKSHIFSRFCTIWRDLIGSEAKSHDMKWDFVRVHVMDTTFFWSEITDTMKLIIEDVASY